MCEYFIGENIISENDYRIKYFDTANYPELPKHKKAKTPLYNKKEFNDIYNRISDLDKNDYFQCVNFVTTAIIMFTGCRPAEARGISWSNVSFQTSRIKIDKQALGNGQIVERVKAEGSDRVLLIPTMLFKILTKWKSWQATMVDGPMYVCQHPTTRTPITDHCLRAFFYKHLEALGLAKIKHIKNDIYEIVESKFKGSPFKSFRHTVSTAVINQQAANPALNDNVIKDQIGHQDIKTTRGIYANHNDLDVSKDMDQRIIEGLDQAIPLKRIN